MPLPRPITIRQQIEQINRRKGKTQSQAQTIAGLLGAPAKGLSPVGTSAPLAPAPTTAAAPLAPKPGMKNDWGDGKRHSISLTQHRANVKTKANDKNALYDPTTQLSGDALRSAAGDLVNLEYGPQRAALARELENTTTQGTALAGRAADYSKQLAATDAGLPTQVAAIGQLLGDKLTANTAASQAGIDSALTGTRDRAAADSAVSGLTLPGLQTGGAEAEAQAQTGRLAELSKSAQDAGAAQSANYQGLAAISGGARAQMGNEVQGELLNRLASQQADVRGRQADESAQEGPALTKNVNDLRQQGFENLITQAGLNVKTADLKEQTANDQAKVDEAGKVRRQKARDARAARQAKATADKAAKDGKASEVNSYGYTNGDWKGMSTTARQKAISDFNKQKTKDTTKPGAAKPADKMTAAAISTRTGIDNAIADIKTDAKLQRHVGEPGPRLTQILTNRGASPIVAQAAAEIAKHGQLSATTIAALKRAGVKIPAEWLPHAVAGVDPPLPGVFG